jgi:drug/metabolite transporter (DMT)-like permease
MLWILITVLSYLLLAITALGDKYLLAGPPEPKSYTFFINLPGILALFLIPFVGFGQPSSAQIFSGLLAGAVTALAGFFLYVSLEKFEASRVIPAIGGILPLFTFLMVYFSSGGKIGLSFSDALAFFLLISGSVLINLEIGKAISWSSLRFSLTAAFLFALSFFLAKNLYLGLSFWTAFIMMRVGGFLFSLVFLLSPEARQKIFQEQFGFQRKTGMIFLANQGLGGTAMILQNIALVLVPLGYLAFVNALEATRYVFLLILSVLLPLKFPGILKEEVTGKIILQKSVAILIIVLGLSVLMFSSKIRG